MLPVIGAHGSAVTWVSDNAALISNNGIVTPDGIENQTVVLTATISYGDISDIVAFILTPAPMSDGVFLTPLQAALVAAVTPSDENPAIPANPDATQLTLGELAGLRRFNVRGLNWANSAFLVERNAIGAAQRVVIDRMLDALSD
jgi:hypothetical protein